MPSICEFCTRSFTFSQSLRRHQSVCREKKRREELAEKQLYEERLRCQQEDFQRERERFQQDLRFQLQSQRERYERELEILYEKNRGLELKIEKLEDQIFEIAKQPTSTTMSTNNHTTMTTHQNQRTVNIINQLGTYEFEEKRIEQILIENFTQDVFLGGPDKIAEFAAQYLLTDPETQKPKVVCTDVSRKVYRYVDPETQELQVDPGFQKTHRMLKRPLEQANLRVFYDDFLRNDPDDLYRDQWKKNDEFIEDSHRFPDKLHQFLKK